MDAAQKEQEGESAMDYLNNAAERVVGPLAHNASEFGCMPAWHAAWWLNMSFDAPACSVRNCTSPRYRNACVAGRQ